MGPSEIVAGTTDNEVVIRIMDATAGTPEQGVTSTDTPVFWYRRQGAAVVNVTDSDLSALTDAHTDGGFLHIEDGEYRFDAPDAAFAVGAEFVQFGVNVSGMIGYGPCVRLLDPAAGIYASVALGGTTMTSTTLHVPSWTFGDDEVNGELVQVYDTSEGEWHPAWITDWVNSTKIATVVSARSGAGLPFVPATSSDRVARTGLSLSSMLSAALDVQAAFNGIGGDVMPASGEAFTVLFFMADATDGYSPETGLTVSAQVDTDDAGFSASANSVTEVGNGWYSLVLSDAEMTGSRVVVTATATGARQANRVIYTDAAV